MIIKGLRIRYHPGLCLYYVRTQLCSVYLNVSTTCKLAYLKTSLAWCHSSSVWLIHKTILSKGLKNREVITYNLQFTDGRNGKYKADLEI